MKSIFCIFFSALLAVSFLQAEQIFAEVNGNSATIFHNETYRNCGSVFDMEVTIDDFQITITEVDNGHLAYCHCFFDLSVTLANLPAGEYSVDVYGTDLNMGEYWGNTSFEIVEPVFVGGGGSDCLRESERTFIDVDVQGNDIVFYYNDAQLNCCQVPDWSGTLSGNVFEIALADVGMPCDCECPFDLWARFGPFAPGDYSIAFLDGIYGVLEFTIEAERWDIVAQNQSDCYEMTQCFDNGGCNDDEYCLFEDCDQETGLCSGRPEMCMDIWYPVCGCDGQTYSNGCYAAMFGQSVDYFGECDEPFYDCAGEPYGTAIIDECGQCCGGSTNIECSYFVNWNDFGGAYDCSGECFGSETIVECFVDPCETAECPAYPDAECLPNYCGGCEAEFWLGGEQVDCQLTYCWSNEECSTDEYCYFEDCAQETGQCEARPDGCWDEWDPVCGCDGETYSNDCFAALEGMSVDYYGECQTPPDGDELCVDLSELDFGDCEMALGLGWNGESCVSFAGCGYTSGGFDYGNWFFDTTGECEALCAEPPLCDDCPELNEGDFGPCDMTLGWTWSGTECQFVSGCGTTIGEQNFAQWIYNTEAQCEAICAGSPTLLGDVNSDNALDVLDIVSMVSYIIGNSEFTPEQFEIADMNFDNDIDVLDIVQLVGIIQGG